MIVKDKNELEIKCLPVSIKEGEEIGVRLLHELGESQDAIGLAANQIGINKRVCVINVKEPIVLINPEIIEKSKEQFVFVEGCLSFDDKSIKTIRHKWIKVKADNHKSTLFFTVWEENNEEGYDRETKLNYALETACVQHEIDHLDGITMFDREYKGVTIKREDKKIGRNDKVLITCGTESKVVKYKKALPLLEGGGWTLVEH